jgi:hypothetical protein
MSDELNKTALKPCPFCGAVPELLSEFEGHNDVEPISWLVCNTDGCFLEDLLDTYVVMNDLDKDALIESWNKRKNNK